ncbi:MAG: Crp/Fnr family transcriptional regulator [Rhodospirillaceae bacterium]|jgi:CRP/FNR family transcriptional regulator, anaerobic regulatory protein|nr:Crp/Fnr family transcriptional regulator [Rhodospirillaceae bacterium]
MTSDWLSSFPGLADIDADVRRALLENGQLVHVPAGTAIFQPGSECGQYLFLVDGSVRVQMVAENGREIVLYRVTGGETCVMTTACLLAHQNYGAEGMAETDIRAVAISDPVFKRLLGASELFREFVFSAYGARLADLMVLVEEVAFRRLDLRLADFLLENQGSEGSITTTHQALAVELGSVREVVSRVLKEFERRGWVKLARGRIEVLDGSGLLGYIDSLTV